MSSTERKPERNIHGGMYCPLIKEQCKESDCMFWVDQDMLGWTNACAIWLAGVKGVNAFVNPIPPERRGE